MNIILWIILGALAGWIASMIAGTDARQGAIGNIVVGILGAFLGGWIMQMFGGSDASLGTFNLYSFLVAIAGATLLLFIYRAVSKKA
ncbi:MAG: GlsB/YeaQ/YmgE family stress response membrane protein [Candidatus Saccharimonadales bacterium]